MPDALPYPLAIARRAVLDASVCPACLHPLVEVTCDACGLRLDGDAGARVWAASVAVAGAIDRRAALVAELGPTTAGATTGAAGHDVPAGGLGASAWWGAGGSGPAAGRLGSAPSSLAPASPPRAGWATSRVLQLLGVGLLAVAALVLLGYRWHDLGTVQRAAAASLPAVAALALAPWLRRRGLPHGAEAVGALAVGLVLLDWWAVRRSGFAPGLSGARYAALACAASAAVLAGWGRLARVRVGVVAAPVLGVAAGALAVGPSPTWSVVAAGAVASALVAAYRARVGATAALVARVGLGAAAIVAAPTACWLTAATLGSAGTPGSVTFGGRLPAGPDGLRLPGLLLGAAAIVGTGLVARFLGPADLARTARHVSGAVTVVALLAAVPALGAATQAEQPAATVVPLVVLGAAVVVLDPFVPRHLHVEARTGVPAALLLALVATQGRPGWAAGVLAAAAAFTATASTWTPDGARALRVVTTGLAWGTLVLACEAADVRNPAAAVRVVTTALVGLAVALHGARAAREDEPTLGRERLAHGGLLVVLASWDAGRTFPGAPPDAVLAVLGVLLVLVGAARVAAVRDLGSWPALGPGTALALAPPLLGLLADPGDWRLVVAVGGGVVAVVVGAASRLQAPFVLGASTLVVVALREAAPLAAQTGWWPVVAVGGAVLLAAGLTYERRLRDARAAVAYVSAMR